MFVCCIMLCDRSFLLLGGFISSFISDTRDWCVGADVALYYAYTANTDSFLAACKSWSNWIDISLEALVNIRPSLFLTLLF